MMVRRVEQHQIEKPHELFPIIDDYSFKVYVVIQNAIKT